MTPVGVFFICQNEDKCHFVNSTILSQGHKSQASAPSAGLFAFPNGQRGARIVFCICERRTP